VTTTRAARYRTLIALAAAALVVVACIVGATGQRSSPSPEPSAAAAASGEARSGRGSDVTFATMPPGSALPSDERCAGEAKAGSEDAQETVPVNIPFNHVRSDQRLPPGFFAPGSGDPREDTQIAARVTGAFTGTTGQILRWAACKWGIDERVVRAQAKVESSWRQTKHGDWTDDPRQCAPDHGLGVDGRDGQCPESFGLLQVRYAYFSGAFPAAVASTAFNVDTAYAVWRACYEGYEWWLRGVQSPGHPYEAGSVWGCIGRWYSGEWFDQGAQQYVDCVQRLVDGRQPCTS
jgi:autotransporter family porin